MEKRIGTTGLGYTFWVGQKFCLWFTLVTLNKREKKMRKEKRRKKIGKKEKPCPTTIYFSQVPRPNISDFIWDRTSFPHRYYVGNMFTLVASISQLDKMGESDRPPIVPKLELERELSNVSSRPTHSQPTISRHAEERIVAPSLSLGTNHHRRLNILKDPEGKKALK